jgi:hypothetical protein
MTAPYGPMPTTGRLVVHSHYHRDSDTRALSGVTVTINGRRMEVGWGSAPFDLPAASYHVIVAARRGREELGHAELGVAISPQQVTTVYYRTTANGRAGRLSLEKPKVSAAVWVAVTMAVVAFGLFLLLIFWLASAVMS